MHVVENPRPNLILARVAHPFCLEDARDHAARIREIFLRNAPAPTAIFTDVRANRGFDTEVEKLMVELMTADNPQLRCAGILYHESERNYAQTLDMMRASRSPLRFISSVRQQLVAWLATRIDVAELEQIESFIEEGDRLYPFSANG